MYIKTGPQLTIVFFFVICLSIFLQLPSESKDLCGKIIDIREKVTILSIRGNEYSIFDQEGMTLDDQVCVIGTLVPVRIGSTFASNPIHRWSNQCNHRGSIDVTEIELILKGNSFRSRLFERVSTIDPSGWLKAFIFSHPAPKNGHFTAIFLSSGLIVSSLVSVLKGGLGYMYTEKKRQYVTTLILLLCWLTWGSSFVLSRILFSDGCRYLKLKPLGRVSLTYVLLLTFYPHHLFHPALVIPLTLSMINVFNYPKFLTRIAMLTLVQTLMSYRFDFLTAIFFPIFRMIAVIGYLFAWLCVFLPQFTEIFIKFCELLTFDSLHIFSYMRLTGSPGIVLAVLWLISVLSYRLSKKQCIIRLCGLLLIFQLRLFINPFTTVTFFNVAQADSALIELPYKQGTWLIDTGRASSSSLLRANLWYRGISHLDAVIISHMDNDHSGGLEMLQKDFSIGNTYTDQMDIEHSGFSLYSLLDRKSGASDNDNSLVHLFSINDFTYLFLGDISKEREADLIRKYPFLRADVLKLAHHGSQTSTSQDLLANLQPRLAIISADPRVYGHPHKQTLRTLWQFRVPYLSTHMDGDIRISTLGNFHFVMSSSGGFGIMRTVIK